MIWRCLSFRRHNISYSFGTLHGQWSGCSPVAADHHHLLLLFSLLGPGPGLLAAVASEEAGGEDHAPHLQETRLHRAGSVDSDSSITAHHTADQGHQLQILTENLRYPVNVTRYHWHVTRDKVHVTRGHCTWGCSLCRRCCWDGPWRRTQGSGSCSRSRAPEVRLSRYLSSV